MMAALQLPPMDRDGLLGRLPPVRGRIAPAVVLDRFVWFRVGGPADVLFRAADAADLAGFLANRPDDVPVFPLGVGSNLLIRDGGIPGVVLRFGGAFATITIRGHEIEAGAGALCLTVAKAAAEAGIAGLEFLSGIPGTIGGALRMNAGAYGRETRDITLGADALDGRGKALRLAAADMGFAYRETAVPADTVFTAARFAGRPDDPAAIQARMDEIQAAREASQPLRTRTGGSTFRNPPPEISNGGKAWELIDRAGCRGLRRGAAVVSEKHCNFLVNEGGATAADLEALGEDVRARVLAHSGIALRWEIHRVGRAAGMAGGVA